MLISLMCVSVGWYGVTVTKLPGAGFEVELTNLPIAWILFVCQTYFVVLFMVEAGKDSTEYLKLIADEADDSTVTFH